MAWQKMCVDCTVFLPDVGADGHPTFQTEEAWKDHRWKSHGGPRPEPSDKESVGPTPKPEPTPEPEPEPEPDPTPEERAENRQLWRVLRSLEERIEALEAKQVDLTERLPLEPIAEG